MICQWIEEKSSFLKLNFENCCKVESKGILKINQVSAQLSASVCYSGTLKCKKCNIDKFWSLKVALSEN